MFMHEYGFQQAYLFLKQDLIINWINFVKLLKKLKTFIILLMNYVHLNDNDLINNVINVMLKILLKMIHSWFFCSYFYFH